jgi:hypothetical protein
MLLGEADRLRQGIIAEGRQHGAEAVWIESVEIDTAPTTDFESLRARPDAIGRLTKILDELVTDLGSNLLGDYPERLRSRMPGIDLPAKHAFNDPQSAALLKAARELLLDRLSHEG